MYELFKVTNRHFPFRIPPPINVYISFFQQGPLVYNCQSRRLRTLSPRAPSNPNHPWCENGRSRSSLSSLARTISSLADAINQSSDQPKDDSSAKYTNLWIKDIRNQPNPDTHLCREMSRLENTIDLNQSYAQRCAESIHKMRYSGVNEAEIASKVNELKTYEKRITDSESALKCMGPCPIKNCSKHHAPVESPETVDKSQYENSILSPNPPVISPISIDSSWTIHDFQPVPPKKAAKNQPNNTASQIETSNKFSQLMEIDESVEAPEIHVPAINLKIVADYNLTLQEINRNFPKTLNKLDSGYIRITPESIIDREKIIDYLDKNKKRIRYFRSP
ncbi:hypothetical protein AVEN_121720-1 [Araneus ventricosus]|uniref:Uncharacterized protein n=1 Tax=Araneus ventricosus TaxID=182803 RepID=A0A4Y2QUI6_ARAVE|nr:hypothetical protein AVEN_121720-1 [Araneus ventricosus]